MSATGVRGAERGGFHGAAIIGVGETRHAGRRTDVNHAELALEAISEALADAGVALKDIDNASTASLDFWDGRTISNMAISEVVGTYLKSEARVCSDGTAAVGYEWARLRDGHYRLGLVVAHVKMSDGRRSDIESAGFDPFTQRRLVPDGGVVAGLGAQAFYARTGLGPRDAAQAVVDARAKASRHPDRPGLPAVSVDDVLAAAVLASPLTALDAAPLADGACALVVARDDVVDELPSADPVWVAGTGTRVERYWADRDLTSTDALEGALADCAALAGWGADAADLIELSAEYSFQMLQFARAIGIDPLDPRCTPSGGRLGGVPILVSGLAGVVEGVAQLRGLAGERQLAGAARAIAHGTGGLGAQSHTVVALERTR